MLSKAEATHPSNPLRNLGTTQLLYFKYWQTYLNTYKIRKKLRKTERNRKKWNTQQNEMRAGEPIRTTQWHNSSFSYGIKTFPEAATRSVLSKKDALKNFANFTLKHLCWSLFWIKFQAWRPATLLKWDSSIAKFLRAPFPKNIRERLLLYIWNPN